MTPDDPPTRTRAEQSGFLALLRALAETGVDLAHNTARMAASEARIILKRLVWRVGLFLGGLMIASVGLLIALLGAAEILAELTGIDPWLAYACVGMATLAAGATIAVRGFGKLGDPDLGFAATLAEFELDVRTLRGRSDSSGEEHE